MNDKILKTKHGEIELPLFMPVATRGFIKAMPWKKVNEMNIKVVISNSVHLSITPGLEKIKAKGGINGYTGFEGSYFTDSGGFQIIREELVDIDDEGIVFKDKKSGVQIKVTPEKSSEIQEIINSDVAMMLDDCPPYGSPKERYEISIERTYRWGKIFLQKRVPGQLRFSIFQGGYDYDLRKKSLDLMLSLPSDGIAIGGLKIGEPKEVTDKIVEYVVPLIPKDMPIYLMGVGDPLSIYEYSLKGIDIFDSTYPTRNARHGYALTSKGPINLKASKYSMDFNPIESGCECEACRYYHRSGLRELLKSEDPQFQYLVTVHNITFMQKLMKTLRENVDMAKDMVKHYVKDPNTQIQG